MVLIVGANRFTSKTIIRYNSIHLNLTTPLKLVKDVSRYGQKTSERLLYVVIKQEYENMVLISFEDLYKILIFPKFQDYSSKIVLPRPIEF